MLLSLHQHSFNLFPVFLISLSSESSIAAHLLMKSLPYTLPLSPPLDSSANNPPPPTPPLAASCPVSKQLRQSTSETAWLEVSMRGRCMPPSSAEWMSGFLSKGRGAAWGLSFCCALESGRRHRGGRYGGNRGGSESCKPPRKRVCDRLSLSIMPGGRA